MIVFVIVCFPLGIALVVRHYDDYMQVLTLRSTITRLAEGCVEMINSAVRGVVLRENEAPDSKQHQQVTFTGYPLINVAGFNPTFV